MKLHFFALVFMVFAFLGSANADDKLYLYIECSPEQECIDLAFSNGKEGAILGIPVQELTKNNIKSAIVRSRKSQKYMYIELDKETTEKLTKIARENLGKKMMVVFDKKIVATPVVAGKILLDSSGTPFWEKAPLLQDLMDESYKASSRSFKIKLIITLAVMIAAFVFVLLPRMKREYHSIPE